MSKSKFDPQKHHRRSTRLKGYDYSQAGVYYVTIVTQGRECLFGEILDGEMYLNEHGEIVQRWWNEISIHFPNVELGAFVLMPNHVHGIIFTIAERRGEVISPRDTKIPMTRTGTIRAGRPRYIQHWDKLLRISNINPPKR